VIPNIRHDKVKKLIMILNEALANADFKFTAAEMSVAWTYLVMHHALSGKSIFRVEPCTKSENSYAA